MSEPKDVRIQLLLSKSEAEAIDEWRYVRRVPNRNEAIRRLIERGILLDTVMVIAKIYQKIIQDAKDKHEIDIPYQASIDVALDDYIDMASGIRPEHGVIISPILDIDQVIKEHGGEINFLELSKRIIDKNRKNREEWESREKETR